MTPFIRLHPDDNVVIARHQLLGGTTLEDLAVRGLIPPGHKVATRALKVGEAVRRYNQIIGFASRPIAPGEHVHTHNLDMGPDKGDFARDYAVGADLKPEAPRREASFMGIQRADGRVATRNYIGILSSVNCSATAARAIADHFSKRNNPAALKNFPNVDGVVALTHGTGCGMDSEGLGLQILQRTLTGYATHANLAGVLVVGLGCESNQIIGFASKPIEPGEHVHTHNLHMGPDKGDFARDYAVGSDVKPEAPRREASFMGIQRADGRVATRNYIGILSSVNCSATADRKSVV